MHRHPERAASGASPLVADNRVLESALEEAISSNATNKVVYTVPKRDPSGPAAHHRYRGCLRPRPGLSSADGPALTGIGAVDGQLAVPTLVGFARYLELNDITELNQIKNPPPHIGVLLARPKYQPRIDELLNQRRDRQKAKSSMKPIQSMQGTGQDRRLHVDDMNMALPVAPTGGPIIP